MAEFDPDEATIEKLTPVLKTFQPIFGSLLNSISLVLSPGANEYVNQVYHYTSKEALNSIISKGELWATCAKHLNDSTEYDIGIECFSTALAECIRMSAGTTDTKCMEYLLNSLNRFEPKQSFILSFGREPDALDPWTRYACNGAGYAIAMGRNELLELGPDVMGMNTLYQTSDQVSFSRLLFSQGISAARLAFSNCGAVPTDSELGFLLYLKLRHLVCCIKHGAFANEREFRIVVDTFCNPTREISVFNGSGAPRIALKAKSGKLPITGVMMGPKVNDKTEFESLRLLLDENGYPDVKISKSAIPYL